MKTSQCPNFEQCPFLTSLLSGGTLMLLRASFQQSLRKLHFFQHHLGRVGALVILTAKPCKGSASQRTALKCKTIQHNLTQSNTMEYHQTQLNKAIELCMNIHVKCKCSKIVMFCIKSLQGGGGWADATMLLQSQPKVDRCKKTN